MTINMYFHVMRCNDRLVLVLCLFIFVKIHIKFIKLNAVCFSIPSHIEHIDLADHVHQHNCVIV